MVVWKTGIGFVNRKNFFEKSYPRQKSKKIWKIQEGTLYKKKLILVRIQWDSIICKNNL